MARLPAHKLNAIVGRCLVPKAFRETLAKHIPYATRVEGRTTLQCPTCLDASGAGEFETAYEWVDHVLAALMDVNLTVRRLRKQESHADAAQDLMDDMGREAWDDIGEVRLETVRRDSL